MDPDTECHRDGNSDSVEKKRTKKELPKSVFAFYIKLYCNKKETKSLKYSSLLIEATKSWVTLSELEKQKFYDKYKEFQHVYSKKIATCLQKSEPYMKQKACIRPQEIHPILNEDDIPEDDNITNLHQPDDNEVNESQNVLVEEKIEMPADIELQREELEYTCVEPHNTALQEPSNISYPEPLCPSLKTGKELFEIIQLNSNNDISWTTLTQKERSLYNKAVLTMKRDYIQKYKQYLENLSSQELFNHYNKCFH